MCQHTEAQTVDCGTVVIDLEAAICHHSDYQGETASGYKIHYDIYFLDLILVEIALWSPLTGLLAAKPVPGKMSPVILLPDMKHYDETEAKKRKRRDDM